MSKQSQYKYHVNGKEVSINEFNSCNTGYILYVDDYEYFKIPKKDVLDSFLRENKEKQIIDEWNGDDSLESIQGVKLNKDKPQLSLLFVQFPKALEAIVRCSEYGHNKYKETDLDYLNFKRVKGGSKTYADAGLRHRLQKGADLESMLPHCYHTAWNALAELELLIEENLEN